jgi:hypothetical protein
VWPGRVEWQDTGQQIQLGTKTALAAAAIVSERGSQITVHGAHNGLNLAFGSASGKDAAIRSTPFDFDLIAGDAFSIRWWALGDSGGGIAGFGIHGALHKSKGVQRPCQVAMGSQVGRVSVVGCAFETDAFTQFTLRFHGSAGPIEIRGNSAPGPVQEHFTYFDNVQGLVYVDNYAALCPRTMLQLDCRFWPHKRPSSGDVYIAGNVAERCGKDGAWVFTLAGHVGGTVFYGMRPNGVMDPNQVIDCVGGGAALAVLDQKQYQLAHPELNGAQNQLPILGVGYMLDAEFKDGKITKRGFGVESLVVYYPSADCDAIDTAAFAFGAVRSLQITSDPRGPATIRTNKAAIDLAHNGQTNGKIELLGRVAPSTWGFVNTTGKAWREGSKLGIDPDVYWKE